MRNELSNHLWEGTKHINVASYFFDAIKSDPKYTNLLKIKPGDSEKVRAHEEKSTLTIPLKNCPIKNVSIEEDKDLAGLLFNVDIGEDTTTSLLRTFVSLKEVKITAKRKGFFGTGEMIGIDVGGGGVPGLSDIEDDAEVSGDILALFKTDLVEMWKIAYVKKQLCIVMTGVKRELDTVETAVDEHGVDFGQILKDIFQVALTLTGHLQKAISK